MNYVKQTQIHKTTCAAVPLSCRGITVYQFTEHYITNANTAPMLILFFVYAFRETWQAGKQRLCGRLIRRGATCGWLVDARVLPTNPCQLSVNRGRIKHATHAQSLFEVVTHFHLSYVKRFLSPLIQQK